MKKTTPCTVHYFTPMKSKKRWFADKADASKWVLRRLTDPNFHFRKIAGDTWEVYSLTIIEEWAL